MIASNYYRFPILAAESIALGGEDLPCTEEYAFQIDDVYFYGIFLDNSAAIIVSTARFGAIGGRGSCPFAVN